MSRERLRYLEAMAIYCEAVAMIDEYQQALSVAILGSLRDVKGLHSQLGLKSSPQVYEALEHRLVVSEAAQKLRLPLISKDGEIQEEEIDVFNARILNRVSVDQSAVDLYTPVRVAGFVFSCITLLGIIVVMSMVVWQIYIIFIPIIALSLWYQQLYVPSSRELIRLAGIATAPIMHHFTETMSGIAIIRCFGHERRFCETSQSLINGHLRPDFYRAAAIQWLLVTIDSIL